MSPGHRLRIFGLAAATAVLLAGCGGGGDDASTPADPSDYVSEISEIKDELVAQMSDIVSGRPPTNPEQAAEKAGELADAFTSAADGIEAVQPPDEVSDLHARLVSSLDNVADRITAAEEVFTEGSAEQASEAAIELQSATAAAQTELNQVLSRINEQLDPTSPR